MTRAYLGLGSNTGDRLANLRAALASLRALDGLDVLACSSVYETEAMDDAAGQADFYNAAVSAETSLSPRELLAACKAIERELGREPSTHRHAPRPIDVDLLLIAGVELEDDDLVLPHPGVSRRRFVLAPLLELDPKLELPGGTSVASALAALGEDQRVVRVAGLEHGSG